MPDWLLYLPQASPLTVCSKWSALTLKVHVSGLPHSENRLQVSYEDGLWHRSASKSVQKKNWLNADFEVHRFFRDLDERLIPSLFVGLGMASGRSRSSSIKTARSTLTNRA
jgi:hypothetical protein